MIEYNRIVAEPERAEVWVYIKKNGLNNGRTIKPDATLKAIFPVPSPRCSSERVLRRRSDEFVVSA